MFSDINEDNFSVEGVANWRISVTALFRIVLETKTFIIYVRLKNIKFVNYLTIDLLMKFLLNPNKLYFTMD